MRNAGHRHRVTGERSSTGRAATALAGAVRPEASIHGSFVMKLEPSQPTITLPPLPRAAGVEVGDRLQLRRHTSRRTAGRAAGETDTDRCPIRASVGAGPAPAFESGGNGRCVTAGSDGRDGSSSGPIASASSGEAPGRLRAQPDTSEVLRR